MADRYSWANADDYNVGNADGVKGKLTQWNRSTVADGKWLNQETIVPVSGRDEYLLDSLNDLGGDFDSYVATTNATIESMQGDIATNAANIEINRANIEGKQDKLSNANKGFGIHIYEATVEGTEGEKVVKIAAMPGSTDNIVYIDGDETSSIKYDLADNITVKTVTSDTVYTESIGLKDKTETITTEEIIDGLTNTVSLQGSKSISISEPDSSNVSNVSVITHKTRTTEDGGLSVDDSGLKVNVDNSSIQITSNAIEAKLSSTGAIEKTASDGLGVKVDNSSIQISSNTIKAKLKTNGGLEETNNGGLGVKVDNSTIEINNSGALHVKQTGGEFGNAVVSIQGTNAAATYWLNGNTAAYCPNSTRNIGPDGEPERGTEGTDQTGYRLKSDSFSNIDSKLYDGSSNTTWLHSNAILSNLAKRGINTFMVRYDLMNNDEEIGKFDNLYTTQDLRIYIEDLDLFKIYTINLVPLALDGVIPDDYDQQFSVSFVSSENHKLIHSTDHYSCITHGYMYNVPSFGQNYRDYYKQNSDPVSWVNPRSSECSDIIEKAYQVHLNDNAVYTSNGTASSSNVMYTCQPHGEIEFYTNSSFNTVDPDSPSDGAIVDIGSSMISGIMMESVGSLHKTIKHRRQLQFMRGPDITEVTKNKYFDLKLYKMPKTNPPNSRTGYAGITVVPTGTNVWTVYVIFESGKVIKSAAEFIELYNSGNISPDSTIMTDSAVNAFVATFAGKQYIGDNITNVKNVLISDLDKFGRSYVFRQTNTHTCYVGYNSTIDTEASTSISRIGFIKLPKQVTTTISRKIDGSNQNIVKMMGDMEETISSEYDIPLSIGYNGSYYLAHAISSSYNKLTPEYSIERTGFYGVDLTKYDLCKPLTLKCVPAEANAMIAKAIADTYTNTYSTQDALVAAVEASFTDYYTSVIKKSGVTVKLVFSTNDVITGYNLTCADEIGYTLYFFTQASY